MANKLRYQIDQAKLGRSERSQSLHKDEAHRFVDELKDLGFGVTKFENLTNKHVGSVVTSWIDKGLQNSTIKSYLSGVRAVAEFYGNNRIHKDNSEFGVGQRDTVSNNGDKAVPDSVFDEVKNVLKDIEKNGDREAGRVLAQINLQREFGLRREESYKFNPDRDILKNGNVFIHAGTKGGRERLIIGPLTDRQKQAVEHVRQYITRRGSSIPERMREEQWRSKYDRLIRKAGLTRAGKGYTSHGLRHRFAHERYEQLSGMKPPCKFERKQDFQEYARQIAGLDWRKVHSDACQILKSELGHGAERLDVIGKYIGSAG
jgi:site-specific recombinase XerD